jgi:hypothetical protein
MPMLITLFGRLVWRAGTLIVFIAALAFAGVSISKSRDASCASRSGEMLRTRTILQPVVFVCEIKSPASDR